MNARMVAWSCLHQLNENFDSRELTLPPESGLGHRIVVVLSVFDNHILHFGILIGQFPVTSPSA
jgi:hypothetical protein